MSNKTNYEKTRQTNKLTDRMQNTTALNNYFKSTDSKISNYKRNENKESCFACMQAGQPCSKHIKTNTNIVDISDLLGETSSDGLKCSPEQKNQLYNLVFGAYIKDVADQLPQEFAAAKAVLTEIATIYLKQASADYKALNYGLKTTNAKMSSANYSNPASSYDGKNNSSSSSYSKN